ncbi:uncharacterized protein LOC121729943 isoform X2 [Aricia agestis]|uniref:uncharacterized protein LOC121729943 isoform X2 n=1 Tax=Aricia agestis TaxID=91739 RepID=UPI001C205B68|nr:uncharacterized protein LOC121729943 isoform X2 [Aricia agestis]
MDFIRDIVRVARGKDETQVLHRSDTVSSEEESRSSLVQESYRINSNRINNAEMLFELSQRWTAEKSIEFLQIYKKFECLWNPKHEKYKNLLARNHAYKDIMEVMGMDSVKVVKAKIRSLRTTHYNETLKAKKNFNYVSRISWVPYLDFINDVRVIDRKQRATKTQEDTQDSYHSDSGSSEESSLIDPPGEKRIKLEDPLVEEVEDSHLQEESDLIDQSVEKRTQIEDLLVQESEESHLQEMVSVPPSKDNDEFGLFGQTVAEQLRQLPLEVALETEEMILSTIRSQRIKILASTTSQIGNFPMKQELD